MGCRFSCIRSSPLSSKRRKSKRIKVVHLDGFVEEMESSPVTVAQVTALSQKHFLFTQAQVQLLAVGAVSPLKPDHLLESGQTYFLLPHSLFEANISPLDLAPIARKLVSMCRKSGKNNVSSGGPCGTPAWRSPGSSSPDSLISDQKSVVIIRDDDGLTVCRKQKPCTSWKPILTTIQEVVLQSENQVGFCREG